MEALNLLPNLKDAKPRILFINFGENEAKHAFQIIQKLRESGIQSELYPENSKMKKQFSYADKGEFTHVIAMGENEIKENMLSLKNLKTGEQSAVSQQDLQEVLRSL